MFHGGEKEKSNYGIMFFCKAVIVVDEGLDTGEILYNKGSKPSRGLPGRCDSKALG